MKYLLTLLLALTFSAQAFANETVPYGNEFTAEIKHYNRSNHVMATSGKLGDGAVAELAQKGFTTIIDLRTVAEGTPLEQQKAEAAGIKYINIPVTGAGIDNTQLAEFTKAYEETEGLVLIHCGSGNRVGAMLANYYISKNIGRDTAISIGRASGMKPSLEATIK